MDGLLIPNYQRDFTNTELLTIVRVMMLGWKQQTTSKTFGQG